MEAEVVRDSLLHVAGVLDSTMGGPDIDFAEGLKNRRRSLYFTHHGEARMPFLEIFDAPDACDAYKRATSVVPQQALALTNNELLRALSSKLADSLSRQSAGDSEFLTAAFEQVLSRPPTVPERTRASAFLDQQTRLFSAQADAAARARASLVRALFSHHDFVTIH
jgi:hypothetical protein